MTGEAVLERFPGVRLDQLRGQAGRRQVPGARVTMLTLGGFFFNAQGLVLRAAG